MLGAVLYACFRPETYVAQIIYNITGFSGLCTGTYSPFGENLVTFVRNHLCDMLWSYSLFFCVFACLKNDKHSIMKTYAVSAALVVTLEISQCIPCLNATFDVTDIVLEIVTSVFAMIIVKKYILEETK